MKNFLSTAACCMVISAVISFTSCTAQVPKANMKTDVDTLSYATGVNMTQGLDMYLQQMGITEEYQADFLKGFAEGAAIKKDNIKATARIMGQQIGLQIGTDGFDQMNDRLFGGDSTMSLNKGQLLAGFVDAVRKNAQFDEMTAQTISKEKTQEIMNKKNEKYKVENLAFLEENKKDADVVVLPSGLQYKVVTEGKGPKPSSTDKVKVHYIGTTIHGTEFDSSVKRGTPFEFSLSGGVIPGWIEGVQLMPVGSKYMLYIPYDLAYGEGGRPGAIDPFATLIFEVELLEIVK